MNISSTQLKNWLLDLNTIKQGRIEYLSFYDVWESLTNTLAADGQSIEVPTSLPSNPPPARASFDEAMDYLDENMIRIERHTEAAILSAPFRKLPMLDENTIDYGIRSWMNKHYERIRVEDSFSLQQLFDDLLDAMVRVSPVANEDADRVLSFTGTIAKNDDN